jgi:hypothetical protein
LLRRRDRTLHDAIPPVVLPLLVGQAPFVDLLFFGLDLRCTFRRSAVREFQALKCPGDHLGAPFR